MLSKTAEYAVRACLWLAEHHDRSWTVETIAESIRVPKRYLAKVLQSLKRASIVRAQPGPGGGYLLARSVANLTLLEIVTAIDPIPRIRQCPVGFEQHSAGLCPLHARLDQALAGVETSLRECTLAQLVTQFPTQLSQEGSTS